MLSTRHGCKTDVEGSIWRCTKIGNPTPLLKNKAALRISDSKGAFTLGRVAAVRARSLLVLPSNWFYQTLVHLRSSYVITNEHAAWWKTGRRSIHCVLYRAVKTNELIKFFLFISLTHKNLTRLTEHLFFFFFFGCVTLNGHAIIYSSAFNNSRAIRCKRELNTDINTLQTASQYHTELSFALEWI